MPILLYRRFGPESSDLISRLDREYNTGPLNLNYFSQA
jgi:hypothetical protein